MQIIPFKIELFEYLKFSEGRRRSLFDIWAKGEEIEFPMIIDEGNKVSITVTELQNYPISYPGKYSSYRLKYIDKCFSLCHLFFPVLIGVF